MVKKLPHLCQIDLKNLTKAGCMGVGRGASEWIFELSAKKGCFLSFEWEKTNFTSFGPL